MGDAHGADHRVLSADGRRPPGRPAQGLRADAGAASVPRNDESFVVILRKAKVTLAGYDAGGRMDPLANLLTPEQRKQKDEDDALLRQLDTMRQSQKGERCEALLQKIERIKKQLAMLQSLAAVNPKAAARQAAQLSRELAQAAKAYASAGADAGATADVTAPADAAMGASAGAETAAAGPSADAVSAEATAGAAGETAPGQVQDEETQQAAPVEGAKHSAAGPVVSAEDEAIREAKSLARKLKAIIEQAKQEALRRRERPDDIARDDKVAAGALNDLDAAGRDLQAQAVADASGVAQAPVTVTTVSISILV